MRLNKYIAQATGCSRREADEIISSGKVKINGNLAVLGTKVSEADKVLVDNQQLHLPEHFTYILLNKPVGYTATRKSQDHTPTVYDLLPDHFNHLKYVGRLDKDSSGLLLLTDDGDFAHQMTHPRYKKAKIYEVKLDRSLTNAELDHLNRGVELEDGLSKLKVSALPTPDSYLPSPEYEVRMSEGRNRQIRRTFSAIGLDVVKLHRTQFGDYALEDLAPGKFIEVKKL
jgi:23S rRNA pseudouridine2605 synthase